MHENNRTSATTPPASAPEEPPAIRRRLTAAIVLRSVALNAAFYISYPLVMIGGIFFLALPRRHAMAALRWWSRVFIAMCRHLGGIELRIEGREHLPTEPTALLVAGKHQSFWETFALFHLFPDPAIVLKRELGFIPLVGWFLRKFRMIMVAREAGPKALKDLVRQGQEAVAANRQIIIFPEGHRMHPLAAPDYKPGVAALYGRLGVACVPFALNAGVFWPRRTFWRWPGTITVRFLPAIEPGLNRRDFMQRLQQAIEPATQELVEEGLRQLDDAGLLHEPPPPRART